MKDDELTRKFKLQYPIYAQHTRKVLATPEDFYYCTDTTTIADEFKKKLQRDPGVDKYEIAALGFIAEWLEYFIYIDNMTDEERRNFEVVMLKLEDHARLRLILERNKLRRTQMNKIQLLLIGKDIGKFHLIINPHNRSWLERIVKTITVEYGQQKSQYDDYTIEEKIHYIDMFATLIRSICIDYINAETPLP